MKKILYYTLWRVEELEEKLHNFELEGWRLKSVTFSYVFNFVKSEPRDSDYIITYNMANNGLNYLGALLSYEDSLLSDYSADKICTHLAGCNFFRITGEKRDFDDLKYYRKHYFKFVLFQVVIAYLSFLIIDGLLVLAFVLNQMSELGSIFACIFIFLSIALFIYQLYGYIKQVIKCKKH